MPYIKEVDRVKWKQGIAKIKNAMNKKGVTPGDLNYLFVMIAAYYLDRKGVNYTHMNDVMGAFTGASQEFYRRIIAPYEDEKIEENGDV